MSGMSHLATASAAGAPHVSIVSAAVEDDVVWVATYKSSRKARNLAENPRAMIMWEGDAEVYVDVDVELVDDAAVKERLWSGTFPYDLDTFFGTLDNPDFVMLRMTPTSAMVQSFGDGGPVRDRWHA